MAGLPLKLIVGLGNPGPEYARTRHNAGWWFVDELARASTGSWRHEPRQHGNWRASASPTTELWLLKPMAFMNRSGVPVHSVAYFYQGPPGRFWWCTMRSTFPPGSRGSSRAAATPATTACAM